MRCRDKDGVTTDSIHVDTRAGFEIVQMDIAVLCDQIDHVIFWSDLITNNFNYCPSAVHLQFSVLRFQTIAHLNFKPALLLESRSGLRVGRTHRLLSSGRVGYQLELNRLR